MDWHDLQSYIDMTKNYSLLTKETELELAHVVVAGRKAAKKLLHVTDPDTRKDLQSIVSKGIAARDRFIKANLRLVISVAKKYQNCDLNPDDLIQEGNMGLMKALDRFNPKFGFRFTTYALWWIQQAMVRAIHGNESIRIPMYKIDQRNRVDHATRSLGGDTPEDVVCEYTGLTSKEVDEVKHLPYVGMSLDAPIADSDCTLSEALIDESVEDTEQELIKEHLLLRIRGFMNTFSERDRSIFDMRFQGYSLEQIGKEKSLTRERVRQIILRHIRILKERSQSFINE